MPASLRSCSSRCRLDEGTPIRRANSETYQAFSGRTSVAARIPWRVFGSNASRVRVLRVLLILSYYVRTLRNCQPSLAVVAAAIILEEKQRDNIALIRRDCGTLLHLVCRLLLEKKKNHTFKRKRTCEM